MKMRHVCYFNNSGATFRLLMSGDINPNPGPVSASTAGKINCLVMNARSLKSYHKDSTTNWQSVCNAENADVICVNETWLNQTISNSEILHSGFTMFRRDLSDRGGGGVLIAIKTASFKAVKEFKPESEAELQQLEIIFAESTTEHLLVKNPEICPRLYKRRLWGSAYGFVSNYPLFDHSQWRYKYWLASMERHVSCSGLWLYTDREAWRGSIMGDINTVLINF